MPLQQEAKLFSEIFKEVPSSMKRRTHILNDRKNCAMWENFGFKRHNEASVSREEISVWTSKSDTQEIKKNFSNMIPINVFPSQQH